MYTHSAAYRHCIGTSESAHGYSASAVLHTINFSLTLGDALWVDLNLTEPVQTVNQIILD